MFELLGDIVRWMEQIPPIWAYVAILLVAYGENVLPPVPGDMIVVFGGYLVGVGKLSFPLVVALSTLGGALGFMTMYAIGHRIGEAVLDEHRVRWLPKKHIHRARVWLERWGYWLVAANRFLSGARSVISLTVGMARLDPARTAALATTSALVWTALIAYGGYELGENWPIIGEYLRAYGSAITLVGASLTAVFALRYYLKWRRAGRRINGEQGTSPDADDQ